jgi:hypothetical protein
MPEHAIHPPIHLVTHPDEPIRSLEAAAKVIRRHAGDCPDRNAQDLLEQIKRASTLQEADAAGKAFSRLGGSARPTADPAGRRKTDLRRDPEERLCSSGDEAHALKLHLRSRIEAIALT